MSAMAYYTIGGVLVAVSYITFLYNRLVTLKNNVRQGWANIEVLLKQRHDELPKLVAACQQYMGYEQQTLGQIVAARGAVLKARNQKDMKALGAAEADLHAGISQLFALAENYPDLKTMQSFLQLQDRISGLENTIADKRELYNDSVNSNSFLI